MLHWVRLTRPWSTLHTGLLVVKENIDIDRAAENSAAPSAFFYVIESYVVVFFLKDRWDRPTCNKSSKSILLLNSLFLAVSVLIIRK